jgi:uncharacterized protein (DUF302 family)
MQDLAYGLGTTVAMAFDEVEALIRVELAEEGFGVLTEIDVAATLLDKLGVARDPYKILGACNPVLANRALEVDGEIGLLLPCNVIVVDSGEGTFVGAMEPRIMARLSEDPRLAEIADEARDRLIRALERVEAAAG